MSYHNPDNRHALMTHYKRVGDVEYTQPRLIAPVLGRVGRLGAGPELTPVFPVAGKAAFLAAAQKQLAKTTVIRVPSIRGQIVTEGGKSKVGVPVSSMWSDWNKSLADVFRPFSGAIDAMPSELVSSSLKSSLKNAPLDALLDVFDPIMDKVGRACDRVLAKKGNSQSFFGMSVNLKRVQDSDLLADASTQNIMYDLRTIQAFFVLFYTQPVDLGIEMLKEGINLAGQAATAISQGVQNAAKAAGDAAAAVIKAGSDAVNAVASWFGLGGLGLAGLAGAGGLGVAGADDLAAAIVSAIAGLIGVSIPPSLNAILIALVGAILAAAGGAAAVVVNNVVTGKDPFAGTPFAAPVKPPPGLPTTALNPSFTGAGAGAGVPVAPSSSLSPAVVFGGAALLAFLVLRR